MKKPLPIVKRSELNNVLISEKTKLYRLLIAISSVLIILTILAGLDQSQVLEGIFPGLESLSTFPILLALDAFAVLILLNLRFKTGPDFWLSTTYNAGLASLIWTIAGTVIIKLYLYQPNLQIRIDGSGSLDPTPSIQTRIFNLVAEQNFTIISLFLVIGLWCTYMRLKTQLTSRWTIAILVLTGALTILTLVRLVMPVQHFIVIWLVLVIMDLVAIKLAGKHFKSIPHLRD